MNQKQVFQPFPISLLLPKNETTSLAFLDKYPNYDGRGIKVAVFDSGIDPGAPGLKVTTDGKAKIIDIMNASGDGDVDTSTVVTLNSNNNTIIGLTGRTLRIPSTWKNPSSQYHIGVKNGYELYSKSTQKRMQKDYENKHWSPLHQKAKADAIRDMQDFEKNEIKSPTKPLDSPNSLLDLDKSFLTQLNKEELQARIDVLNSLGAKYCDLGPTYDVIVFYDGTMWRACLDTSEKGDLEKCQLLGSYKETFEYGTISEKDMLNYTINVHDDGNLLEICRASSDHGTHVASIIASNFPDEPEKNGIAPGAQLISIAISDSRGSESMETGSSLIRACIKAIEAKVDIINMSFTDQYSSSYGRILDLMNQVVDKYGIIFVVCAGNSGPGFSTVLSSTARLSLYGVGAYVSPEMMTAGYSLWRKMPGRILTFSSKDPNLDGGLSVAFCAPGAAFASVSEASLTKAQYFNGTSMSSPNAAGCVTLLLSGLKNKDLPYTPYSIRRALENTALKTAHYDPLAMGAGLIQVEPAFEYCVKYSSSIERDVQFRINTNGKQGIYLYDKVEVRNVSLHQVTIEPRFINHDDYKASDRLKFEMNLNLVSNESWIECPSLLHLTASSRTISIKVDPTGLPLGIHFTKIKAYDSFCLEKGVIFLISVTVIKAIAIEARKVFELSNLKFGPGVVQNWFFTPPSNSTLMIITILNNSSLPSGHLFLCVRQLFPQEWGFLHEQNFSLNSRAKTTFAIEINNHKTVAVSIAKWWSGLVEVALSFKISFEGSQPFPSINTMLSSQGLYRIDVYSSSNEETIHPKVTFNNLVVPLKPVESKITPLGHRDITPNGAQIYQLILTYNFTLPKITELSVNCPFLSNYLYDSPFESQLWLIFNSYKQFMLGGDAFPHKYKKLAKLEKGDYIVKLQVRHEDITLLEKLTELSIHLNQKLTSTIMLNEYSHYKEAMIDGKKFNLTKLPLNEHIVCFFTSIPNDKLPKNMLCPLGSFLSGSMSISKDEVKKKIEKYPFKYVIDSEISKKPPSPKVQDEKPIEVQFKEALIDFKINWLSKFSGASSDFLYFELSELQREKKISLLFARIQALENDQGSNKHYNEIISLSDEILSNFNQNELMGSLASAKSKKKNGNGPSKELIKNLEKEIEKIVDALCKKACAIIDILESKNENADLSTSHQWTLDSVDIIYNEVSKLIDLNESRVYQFLLKHCIIHKHYGRALKLALKQKENKPSLELEKQIIDLCSKLKWTHCQNHLERSLHVKYPPNYRPF